MVDIGPRHMEMCFEIIDTGIYVVFFIILYYIFYYYIILYMTETEISIESEAFNGNKRNTNEHWTFYGAKQDDKTLEIELFLQKRTEYGSKWGICTLPPPGSVWDLLWPLSRHQWVYTVSPKDTNCILGGCDISRGSKTMLVSTFWHFIYVLLSMYLSVYLSKISKSFN